MLLIPHPIPNLLVHLHTYQSRSLPPNNYLPLPNCSNPHTLLRSNSRNHRHTHHSNNHTRHHNSSHYHSNNHIRHHNSSHHHSNSRIRRDLRIHRYNNRHNSSNSLPHNCPNHIHPTFDYNGRITRSNSIALHLYSIRHQSKNRLDFPTHNHRNNFHHLYKRGPLFPLHASGFQSKSQSKKLLYIMEY